MRNTETMTRWLRITVAASLLAVGAGCQKQAAPPPAAATPGAPTDQQITADITSRLNAESALNGQPIQLSVENGRAILSGSVSDDASRSLAANDAASAAGVRTVINNLAIRPANAANQMPAMPTTRKNSSRDNKPQSSATPMQNQAQTEAQRAQEPVRVVPPAASAAPVTRTYTVPAGTTVPVRLTETLETGKTQADTVFHGSLASDLTVNGVTAIPRGASVLGRVVDAKDAGHYSGNSVLTLELTQVSANGKTFRLTTDPYTQQGKGRGKNTAEKVGAGAGIGALIGAIAGGGKGAAIGAAAGGGLGAGANTITRGQQVQIPSETVVNFRLQNSISVTTGGRQVKSYDSGDAPQQDPTLQQR